MDFKPIKKNILISHWKLACSCQEITKKLLSFIGVTQQSFTSSFKRKWETTLARILCNWEITEFSQIYCIFVWTVFLFVFECIYLKYLLIQPHKDGKGRKASVKNCLSITVQTPFMKIQCHPATVKLGLYLPIFSNHLVCVALHSWVLTSFFIWCVVLAIGICL